MRAAFIKNKYYTDSGMQYVEKRLTEELERRGVTMVPCKVQVQYGLPLFAPAFDFAVFWDKDVRKAALLERMGVRLFNSARAVEVCDDKEKTFAAVADGPITVPPTVAAPLVFAVTQQPDAEFLHEVAAKLGYPVVVKENTGSLGQQVYLAEDFDSLIGLSARLLHTPHLYQQYVSGKFGSDVRVYVVGGQAIAAVERTNTTDFKSNVCMGGTMTPARLSPSIKAAAEWVAARIGLAYGSADFILKDGAPVFIEANSNAYFRAAEGLGIDIAGPYAAHMVKVMQHAEG